LSPPADHVIGVAAVATRAKASDERVGSGDGDGGGVGGGAAATAATRNSNLWNGFEDWELPAAAAAAARRPAASPMRDHARRAMVAILIVAAWRVWCDDSDATRPMYSYRI